MTLGVNVTITMKHKYLKDIPNGSQQQDTQGGIQCATHRKNVTVTYYRYHKAVIKI